jgi:ABC-type branched-subunit amino acid transport system ATPase component
LGADLGRANDVSRGGVPAPPDAPLLAVEQVRGGYDDVDVLRGVTFALMPHTVTAVIGPNGAGKSTLLRAIYGRLRLSAGVVRFRGEVITDLSPGERRRRGLAYVAQGRCNFPMMTVHENLEMAGFIRRDARVQADIDRCFARFPLLRQHARRRAGDLSGGQQQLLELVMGLLAEPTVLLVDEPSMGLAPAAMGEVWATLSEIRGAGTTILLVEQNARKALELADRGLVLDLGEVRHAGPAPALLADPAIRRMYLGG